MSSTACEGCIAIWLIAANRGVGERQDLALIRDGSRAPLGIRSRRIEEPALPGSRDHQWHESRPEILPSSSETSVPDRTLLLAANA
jgi:hypothetical protein